jgi:hypothetical protein
MAESVDGGNLPERTYADRLYAKHIKVLQPILTEIRVRVDEAIANWDGATTMPDGTISIDCADLFETHANRFNTAITHLKLNNAQFREVYESTDDGTVWIRAIPKDTEQGFWLTCEC